MWGEGGSYSHFLRYRPHSFPINPHLCGIFIFKNHSETFFKSEVVRGQIRTQKRPQDDFLNINTWDMSFPVYLSCWISAILKGFRVVVVATSRVKAARGCQDCLNILISKYSHVIMNKHFLKKKNFKSYIIIWRLSVYTKIEGVHFYDHFVCKKDSHGFIASKKYQHGSNYILKMQKNGFSNSKNSSNDIAYVFMSKKSAWGRF